MKRRLRKGTHSCWACKRRKERCRFDDGEEVCVGCQRRGTTCVSQHFADDSPTTSERGHSASGGAADASVMAARLERIEDMLIQLTSTDAKAEPIRTETTTIASNAAVTSFGSSYHQASILSSLSDSTARPSVLSQTLHSSLPCSQDINLLRQATARRPVLSIVHLTTSYTTLGREGFNATAGRLDKPPLVTTHLVLIARYMLQIAVSLQYMSPATYPEMASLIESADMIRERCASMAISLVTRQDELLSSVESLECVILESVYQCNSGRLQLGWKASRRAMLLAQTMGLHLATSNDNSRKALQSLDPLGVQLEPAHVWFRLRLFDLQLSRMLGLPAGAIDANSSEATSQHSMPDDILPEERLERTYSRVMTVVLTQRTSSTTNTPPDMQTTQALDQELQRAAQSVPSQWWLPPNLAESSRNQIQQFWDLRRILTQMLHQDLRNQLHVPYMLCRGQGEVNRQRFDMARLACANCSREVLSRFMLLREFDQKSFGCHFANLLGLMAAITLVLAHLGDIVSGGQFDLSSQVAILLSHQAPSDRAMVQQMLEAMQDLSVSSGDALWTQRADILCRLLEIEAKRERGESVHVSVRQGDQEGEAAGPEGVFLPYLGVIRIIREDQAAALDGFGEDLFTASYDDAWMSQSIDLAFLDTFLDGAPVNSL